MTTRTRYVFLGGAGILAVGVVTGLVAYLQGGERALSQSGPDELRYVPAEASVVAYANVRDLMLSDFRQRLRDVQPNADGQQDFRGRTGIDIANDIDRIIACLVPGADAPENLVVASGRFDSGRLEELALERGGTVEEYRGTRLVTRSTGDNEIATAFIEPGLVALGSSGAVRRIIDLPTGGDVTSNSPMMELLTHVQEGSDAWVIARFDDPTQMAWLPDQVQSQIPALAAFAAGGHVNGGVQGTVTAEAHDEQAGQNLSEVVRGFLALARMQGSSQPRLTAVLDTFRLTSVGTTVTLSFDLPPEVLEMVFPEQSADIP